MNIHYRDVALWGLLLLMLVALSSFVRPDIPPDETRYISVAWEAWRSNDWLVMHMNGEPYHHKPPLLFWLIGLGWRIFGVNDWWPRAISGIASFFSVLLVSRIATYLWPQRERVGNVAGWLTLTSIYWLAFGSSVMFDVVLTAFTLLALVGILDVWHRGGWRGWVVCGVAMGLGVLTKGPFILIFVLPVAVTVRWWGGVRSPGKAWWCGVFVACALGAAVSLMWIVPAAIAGGAEYREALLWRQVAGRVSGELAHRQPAWYYLAAFLVLFFPLASTGYAWRCLFGQARAVNDQGRHFVFFWVVPAFIALSLSGGKQLHYILPIWPAIALLIAAKWAENHGNPGAARQLILLPIILAALGTALVFHAQWTHNQWFAPYAGTSWQIGGGALILLGILAAIKWRWTPEKLSTLSVVIFAVLLLTIVRSISPIFDTTPFAEKLATLQETGMPLVHVSGYNDQFHFYGRLTRPILQISRGELAAWFAAHPEGRAIVYIKHMKDAPRLEADFVQPYNSGGVALISASALERWQSVGG